FFSSRRRHTRLVSDWSSDVCSSDLCGVAPPFRRRKWPLIDGNGQVLNLLFAGVEAGAATPTGFEVTLDPAAAEGGKFAIEVRQQLFVTAMHRAPPNGVACSPIRRSGQTVMQSGVS